MNIVKNIERIKLKNKNIIKIDKSNYNLLNNICSKSTYSFNELYYVHANHYFTCLQIFDFMKNSYDGFLDTFVDNPNVVVTVDVENISEVKWEDILEKTVGNVAEIGEGTKKIRKYKKANEEIRELNHFDNFITQRKESVKSITVRLYIFAKTKNDLQEKLDEVTKQLKRLKMRGYIQTNNLRRDVRALTKLDNSVDKIVSASTVAEILFRGEITVIENNMPLLGHTVNGLYAPDIFSTKNSSYNVALLGGLGAGKSAMLKLLNENYLLYGNHTLFLFDRHHEYKDFCEIHGIEQVSVNEDSNINICQIFYSEDGIITQNDITSRISVILESFKNNTGYTQKEILNELIDYTNDMYKPYLGKSIEELTNEDWFTLSDIYNYICSLKEENKVENEGKQAVYNLIRGLKNMISTYGYIYDRKTNIEFDLTKSLCIDMSFLLNNVNKEVNSAYATLLLSYISEAIYYNKKRNEELMKRYNVKPYQLKRPMHTCTILVDETMEYNTSNFLTQFLSCQKISRKAYVSMQIVVHATKDLKQDLSIANTGGSLLNSVFELCTNKFIGKTELDSLYDLQKIIRELSDKDIEIISSFKKGKNGERQFCVVDDQSRKIFFESIINNYQKNYFGGGV